MAGLPVCVLVVTDGRIDYLPQAIASLEDQLHPHDLVTTWLLHDDSGDPTVHDELRRRYPRWHLAHTPGRSGFGGAYRHAWAHVRMHVREPWVFSTEDDFELTRPVDLAMMQAVMDQRPYVAQMALQRQPWSGPEIEHGGVIGLNPAAYVDRESVVDGATVAWLEHRQFWTTNPSLHRSSICELGWPEDPRSESTFAARLFADPTVAVGYWGTRDDGPWAFHIGDEHHPEAKGY